MESQSYLAAERLFDAAVEADKETDEPIMGESLLLIIMITMVVAAMELGHVLSRVSLFRGMQERKVFSLDTLFSRANTRARVC